jgi:excisionase family DNA binding protein
MDDDNDDIILDMPRAAKLLGVSQRTVRFWVERKRVPYIKYSKVVRFSKRDLLAYIESRKRQPTGAVPLRHEPTLIK